MSQGLGVKYSCCVSVLHYKPGIQEHVLPVYDLTMLNSAVSSVQHQITLTLLIFKNTYYLCMILPCLI